MQKQLTDKQIWRIWINEYNLLVRSGFSHAEAVLKADALAATKRAQTREAADNTNATYWCQSIGRRVTVPEDEE